MFAYLKHSFLVGLRRCLDFLGLSLHPLKKLLVSEQRDPDKIGQKRRLSWAFADHIFISTSPYDFIMLGSSD